MNKIVRKKFQSSIPEIRETVSVKKTAIVGWNSSEVQVSDQPDGAMWRD